jgi:hypothetical protein
MSADDGDKEGGKEGGQQEGDSKQAGHGKTMTFPELMYWMWSVLGTNERLIGGNPTAVRLSTSSGNWFVGGSTDL